MSILWLYQESKIWVLSSRAHRFAEFNSEAEAIKWWQKFEDIRKLDHREPVKSRPPKKTNRSGSGNIPNSTNVSLQSIEKELKGLGLIDL